MGPVKRLASAVYLVACVAVLGSFGLSLSGPLVGRMAYLRGELPFRAIMFAGIAIMAVQALYVLGLTLFSRREPVSVHPDANPDIEVTREAIASLARAAAAADDVMVENVEVRIVGRSRAHATVLIEAIPLVNDGLEGLARRMQLAVGDACDRMLGVSVARVRVRFLPARTVTTTVPHGVSAAAEPAETKEVSGEQA